MTTTLADRVSTSAVTLPIGTLVLDGSPRRSEHRTHIQRLAAINGPLPPILVHRQTRQVIDGIHRVRAAMLRGERTIAARLFHGDVEAAFVQAVKINLTDGLRLSLSERRAAAQRIIIAYPQWSDRKIATAAGLAPSTIRGIRQQAGARAARLPARVGRDGRVRPVTTAQARRLAASLIQQRPAASLREIAQAAGVSVGTAHDVRRRLRAGTDPVPERLRSADRAAAPVEVVPVEVVPVEPVAARSCHTDQRDPARDGGGSARQRGPAAMLAILRSDPSVRYTERGRWLIRLLGAHLQAPGGWSQVVESVPPHNAEVLAELAMGCARAWREFAEQIRARDDWPG